MLNEIAAAAQVGIEVDEAAVPIQPDVHGLCEILGLDPLYLANEGKLIAVVPEVEAEQAIDAMRRHAFGAAATRIGRAVEMRPGRVTMRSVLGGNRIVDMLSGEQLPRIC